MCGLWPWINLARNASKEMKKRRIFEFRINFSKSHLENGMPGRSGSSLEGYAMPRRSIANAWGLPGTRTCQFSKYPEKKWNVATREFEGFAFLDARVYKSVTRNTGINDPGEFLHLSRSHCRELDGRWWTMISPRVVWIIINGQPSFIVVPLPRARQPDSV